MRIPNPIANTTTEAYLAYKAGVLAAGDLKPKLYYPYLHFDAWLAYWAGLVDTYPIHDVGKNLFDKNNSDLILEGLYLDASKIKGSASVASIYIKCKPNTTYTISKTLSARFRCATTEAMPANGVSIYDVKTDASSTHMTITTSPNANYLVVFCYIATYDTLSLEQILNTIQIEEGSTATPYEPYTGTPEMFTDEEALVAYLSGVTDTYPETVKDPEDVRIAGYLRYLVSARFGRPAYPVNNRELYLSMLKPPVVTNETPSANIYLEDTVKAEFVSLEMFGDTSQQTYTGKNLLELRAASGYGVEGTITDGSTITVTGTATTTDGVKVAALQSNLAAGTYTLTIDHASTHVINVVVANNDGNVAFRLAAGETYITKTLSSDSTGGDVYWAVTQGQVYNETFKLQLVAGSIPDYAYEPYVGGVPAPNPDYPQEVQTVTGEQEIFITGKNLLDSSRYNAEAGGLTNKLNADGTITTTGIITKNYVRIISDTDITDILEDGQTYTCSETEGAPEHVVAVQVRALKRAGGYDYYLNSFTVDKTTHESYQIAAQTGTMEQWGSESRTITCGYQLEKGSVATDFEPYRGRQQYIINLNGKNLFDKANANTFAGTVGTTAISPGGSNKILYVPCLPEETYTVQKRNDGDTNRFAVATTHDLPEGGVAVTGMIQRNNASSITITTAPNARYLVIMYYRTQETVVTEQQVLDSIQIEEGAVATVYEPFHGNIELCKTEYGTEIFQDYIYKDGDGWKIHKSNRKVVLDGSTDEIWDIRLSGTPNFFYQNYNGCAGSYGNPDNARWLFSNYGTPSQVTSTNTAQGIFILGSGNLRIRYGTEMSLDDWKAKLSTTPMSIYYALATPTDTQITNPALIAQLDALAGGNSYDTTTYITVTSAGDNLPGLLKVEAGTESVS